MTKGTVLPGTFLTKGTVTKGTVLSGMFFRKGKNRSEVKPQGAEFWTELNFYKR